MLDDLLARIDAVLAESTPPSPRASGDTRWHPDRCTCHACRGKTSSDAFRPAGAPPPYAWAGVA